VPGFPRRQVVRHPDPTKPFQQIHHAAAALGTFVQISETMARIADGGIAYKCTPDVGTQSTAK
jgi:hypothetical protein